MAQRDDILVDETPATADGSRPLRVRMAAFVPITLAIIGIGAVLLGGVSARQNVTAVAPAIDTIATGSISP